MLLRNLVIRFVKVEGALRGSTVVGQFVLLAVAGGLWCLLLFLVFVVGCTVMFILWCWLDSGLSAEEMVQEVVELCCGVAGGQDPMR